MQGVHRAAMLAGVLATSAVAVGTAAALKFGPFASPDVDDLIDAAKRSTSEQPSTQTVVAMADASGRPIHESIDMIRTADGHSRYDFEMLPILKAGLASDLTPAQFDALVGAKEIGSGPSALTLIEGYIDGSRFSLDDYIHVIGTANAASEHGEGVVENVAAAEQSTATVTELDRQIRLGTLVD